jgi:hypothetical protein
MVGGLGGVFRTSNPGAGTVVWNGFGAGLPNAYFSEIIYNKQDDVLVAGTVGRGEWKISSASAALAAPTTLQIDGTGSDDKIVLIREANQPRLLDVMINDVKQATVPVGSIDTININGAGGTDTITLNEINGAIDNTIVSPGITPQKIHGVSGLVAAKDSIVKGLGSAVDWIQGIFGTGEGSKELPGTGQSIASSFDGGEAEHEQDNPSARSLGQQGA